MISKLKLHNIRGGNKTDLEQKKYTIGVGLSLGNKWFTPENIIEEIKWALEYSKDKVVVYVADSIHAINISVRSRRSIESARRIAFREGEELFSKVKEGLKFLSDEQLNKISFVKWDEIVDGSFTNKLVYLRARYNESGLFQDTIHAIVRNHVSHEDRKFSDDDIHMLGSYIVEELPECANRVPMKGIIVDAYMYPQDNELVAFIERIQKGEVFPEIKEKIMDTEPKVFLEVR